MTYTPTITRDLLALRDKISPGPWRVSYERGTTQIRTADNKSIMGDETYYPWVPDNMVDWDLIAAAPDMLDLLEALSKENERLREAIKRQAGAAKTLDSERAANEILTNEVEQLQAAIRNALERLGASLFTNAEHSQAKDLLRAALQEQRHE